MVKLFRMNAPSPLPARPLPMTHWSMVKRAFPGESNSEPRCLKSQDEFCRIYWPVIHLSLRQKHGFNHHDAEDLAQNFVAWLLKESRLDNSRQEKGRFRSYLLAHLDNYVRNHRQKTQAEKRGGKLQQISLDDVEEGAARDERTPDKDLQRAWGIATLREAHERIRRVYEERGKGPLFYQLLPFLTAHEDERRATSAAAALRMSLPAFRMARSRFRKEFGLCISDLVAATVENEAEFQEEMQLIREIAG
jgi:hypothetical protein